MEIQAHASVGLIPKNGKMKIIRNPRVTVEENRITNITSGLERNESVRGVDVLEGGKVSILMPTFVNTHTHAAMTLMRGITDDVPLMQWLNDVVWPLEKHLEEWHVQAGAQLAALESLMTGTTVLNSHYFYPSSEAKGFLAVGIRGIITDPIIEIEEKKPLTDELVKAWHGKHDDMIRVSFGPHAPYTVTRGTYEQLVALQKELNEEYREKPVLIHTHVSETQQEFQAIKAFLEKKDEDLPEGASSTVEYLNKIGVLNEDLIGAHYVWTSPHDQELIREKKAGVSINLISNLKLGSGVPPLIDYVKKGLKVSFGTDGASSNNTLNMFEMLRLVPLVYKGLAQDPTVLSLDELLYFATKGGADSLHWKGLGELREGGLGDFMILELDSPTTTPVAHENAAMSDLVYASSGVHVKHVVVNGEVVLRDGIPTRVDIEEVKREAYRAMYDLLEKAGLPRRYW